MMSVINFIAAAIIGFFLWNLSISIADTALARILLFLPFICLHLSVAFISIAYQRIGSALWWIAIAPVSGVLNAFAGHLLDVKFKEIVVNDRPSEFFAGLIYSLKLLVMAWNQTLVWCISSAFWIMVFAALYFLWIRKWPEFLANTK